MTRESGARWRGDHEREDVLSLDTLDAHERGTYRSGAWIGPRVASTELTTKRRADGRRRDPEGIAELAARAQFQIEQGEA